MEQRGFAETFLLAGLGRNARLERYRPLQGNHEHSRQQAERRSLLVGRARGRGSRPLPSTQAPPEEGGAGMTPAAIKGLGRPLPSCLPGHRRRGAVLRQGEIHIAWEAQTPRRGIRWEMNRSGSSSPSGSATTSAFGSGAPRESGAADMATRAHDAMTARTFDAAGWFWALSQHGRVAMLTGDRLWVGRISPLDREAVQALDQPPLSLHTPGAGNALAGLLQANVDGRALSSIAAAVGLRASQVQRIQR